LEEQKDMKDTDVEDIMDQEAIQQKRHGLGRARNTRMQSTSMVWERLRAKDPVTIAERWDTMHESAGSRKAMEKEKAAKTECGQRAQKEKVKTKEDMAKLEKVEESGMAQHPLEVVSNVEDRIINRIAQD